MLMKELMMEYRLRYNDVKIDPAIIIDINGGRGSVNHKVIQLTLRHFRLDCL